MRPVGTGPGLPEGKDRDRDRLLAQVARGDEQAFASAYDQLAGPVYRLIRRVVRNPAQSEEVAQEVLLEVWRTASRFDPAKGSAATWVMTIAHRRAVDRVRSATAAAEREQRTAQPPTSGDDVAEAVEASIERERLRRCLEHSVTQAISSGGRVTLVYSLRRHAMVATTHGLPAPPPGKVYQLCVPRRRPDPAARPRPSRATGPRKSLSPQTPYP